MHLRYLLAVLIFAMALAVNAPASSLASMGVDRGILMGALVATIVTGLYAFKDLGFVCLMLVLIVGANLPAEIAGHFGIDTRLLLVTLVSMVLLLTGRRVVWFLRGQR
jgi:hypothetical protein